MKTKVPSTPTKERGGRNAVEAFRQEGRPPALADLARLLARQAARSLFSNISDHPQAEPVPTGRHRNGGDTNGRD